MEERTGEQKRARMVGQSLTMADLPSHILIEIISRLPIKTVMAIRCVCKSLLSLVSDSHFQILHSTRAPTELCYSALHHISHGRSSTTLSIVLLDDSLTAVDAKSTVVFELPNFSVQSTNYCNFGATSASVSFVNSCCGLVCYTGPPGNVFAVICNPFTREFITFPCPTRTDKTVKRGGIYYGLGFSPKDNSFKLLRLTDRNYVDTDSGKQKSRVVGDIYTFGKRGSWWKMVANCPHVYMLVMEKAIFHEGALYWYRSCFPDAIVSFDFDTELFGKLITPPRHHYEPFKYLQNGEVLMFKNQSSIVCFNPNTGSIKNVSGILCREGAVFIRPNLVSLKVLLGDNVKIHSVKPWDRNKVATIPRALTSSVAVKDIVKADKDSRGCLPGSSAPSSSSEPSTSTSHPTKEKVEDVVPAILESQQCAAEAGSLGSQIPRPPKDRHVGQISETQKLADEIATLKAEDKQKAKVIGTLNAENERKGKVIENLNVENDRQGKVIAKLQNSAIKSAAYSLLRSFIKNIPQVFNEANMKTLAPAILGAFQEKDPACHPSMWEALLLFSKTFPGSWTYINVQKIVLNRCWHFLRNGCFGSQKVSYPALVLFLDAVPPKAIAGEMFFLDFFHNLWAGRNPTHSSNADRVAFFQAFEECFMWALHNASRYCDGADSVYHFRVTLVEDVLVKHLWQDYLFPIGSGNLESVEGTLNTKYPLNYLQELGKCIVAILSSTYALEHNLLSLFCAAFQEDCLLIFQPIGNSERPAGNVEQITKFLLLLKLNIVSKGKTWPLESLVGPMLGRSFSIIRLHDRPDGLALLSVIVSIFGPRTIFQELAAHKGELCIHLSDERDRELKPDS